MDGCSISLYIDILIGTRAGTGNRRQETQPSQAMAMVRWWTGTWNVW
jgi:hypothetical protein